MRGLVIALCLVLSAAPAWSAPRRAPHPTPAVRADATAKSAVPGYPDVIGEYLPDPRRAVRRNPGAAGHGGLPAPARRR